MLSPKCEELILSIGNGQSVGEPFLEFFRQLVMEAEEENLPTVTLIVPMYNEITNPINGEYLAELHFVVRKVEKDGAYRTEKVDEATEESS